MSGQMHTHAWRIPDADIRSDVSGEIHAAVTVMHLPSGRATFCDASNHQPKNYISARTKLEAWVLDGVLP